MTIWEELTCKICIKAFQASRHDVKRGRKYCSKVCQYEGQSRNHGTVEERFWRFVTKGECWAWNGSTVPFGHGQFWNGKRLVLAHRFSYEMAKGPITEGLVIDHICRNPPCVNPDHLRQVTIRQNGLHGVGFGAINIAKTHCLRGHALTGDNALKRNNRPGRECAECKRVRDLARLKRNNFEINKRRRELYALRALDALGEGE